MSVDAGEPLDQIIESNDSETTLCHTDSDNRAIDLNSMLSSMHEGISQTNELILQLVQSMQTNSNMSCSPSEQSPKRAHVGVPGDTPDDPAPKRAKRAPQSGQQSSGKDHTEIEPSHGDTDDILSLFGQSEVSESEDNGDIVNDNDDFLTSISQDLFASDDAGPAISDKLAKITDKNFVSDLEIEKLKSIIKKYKRPENCEQLYVPKVNPEIWYKIPGHARKKDIKIANLQDTLLTSISAVMTSLNDIIQSHETKKQIDCKQIASKLIDAVALIGHVSKELSFKRREAIKPFLHKDFKQACSRTNKVESLLFGTDLAAKAQQIKNASKVVQNVTATDRFTSSSSRPQYSGGNTANPRPPFLYQRGRPQPPPRKNPQNYQPPPTKKRFPKH